MIKLVVGLCNPGDKYVNTRHNAGAWFVQALAECYHSTIRVESKFLGLHGRIQSPNFDCHLLLPSTFMNRSGQSIQALATFYKIKPEDILIAHDELDLSVGEVRLKQAGGHGGHNGLRDTIAHIGKDFNRLRLGIDRPKQSSMVVDYVLSNPSQTDREHINQAIENALHVFPLAQKGDWQKAMTQLHTRPSQ